MYWRSGIGQIDTRDIHDRQAADIGSPETIKRINQ